MLSALHAHRWGEPWTTTRGMGIWPLDKVQHRLLVAVCEARDAQRLLMASEFSTIWLDVAQYIDRHRAVHVRISTASPKDAVTVDGHNPLRATSPDQVAEALVSGFRVLEDLDEGTLGAFALCLMPWDDRIEGAAEYRCLIYGRRLECAVCTRRPPANGGSSGLPDLLAPPPSIMKQLGTFVEQHATELPEPHLAMDVALVPAATGADDAIVFIEFNPADAELDVFGLDLETAVSADLRRTLASDPSPSS